MSDTEGQTSCALLDRKRLKQPLGNHSASIGEATSAAGGTVCPILNIVLHVILNVILNLILNLGETNASWRILAMGGQGVERRDILRFIGIASVASTFPGFSKWAFACPQDHAPLTTSPPASGSYQPLFFSPRHYRMVEHLAEMIIPEDDTPGAKKAGVAEFIDFMVANRVPVSASREVRSTQDAIAMGDEAQIRFLSGLDWINARAKSEFGREFMDCAPEQQNSLLEELAYKAKFKPTTESGRAFFQLIRDYTVVGYYTTKIGLESIGYPGLRVAWPSMPGCTHRDDPEHAKLREPASPSISAQKSMN